jgi:hypothetical protein
MVAQDFISEGSTVQILGSGAARVMTLCGVQDSLTQEIELGAITSGA